MKFSRGCKVSQIDIVCGVFFVFVRSMSKWQGTNSWNCWFGSIWRVAEVLLTRNPHSIGNLSGCQIHSQLAHIFCDWMMLLKINLYLFTRIWNETVRCNDIYGTKLKKYSWQMNLSDFTIDNIYIIIFNL